MTNWKTELCSTQPLELEVIAPGLYMQRKNIHSVEHEATDIMPAYVGWECESREISVEEYHRLTVDDKLETQQSQIDYIAMMSDIDLEEV